MFVAFLLASLAIVSSGTPAVLRHAFYSQPAPVIVPVRYTAPVVLKESPKPYSFGYVAPASGGGSSRQETSDGNGRVTGSYTVTDADGRVRVVDYYADETGFHANVKTNEPGTANQDSADVSVQSYADTAHSVAPASVVVEEKAIAPAPLVAAPRVYAVAAAPVRTITRRVVSPLPVTYAAVPTYRTVRYAPVSRTYGVYDNGYIAHSH
ncbi:Cuticle protein 14 isoform a, partial [Stegodyphus mimosarum]